MRLANGRLTCAVVAVMWKANQGEFEIFGSDMNGITSLPYLSQWAATAGAMPKSTFFQLWGANG